MKKILLYLLYLAVVVIIFLEIFLRFYYPFQRKIRGDSWHLATNVTYHMKNDLSPRLDPVVTNKRNNIGFRGEDLPGNINSRFTILTVGGSTTACNFLGEGKTWTDRLSVKLKSRLPNVWVNNAGIDGNSTYGHINFLRNYLLKLPLKPRIILFLIGANDIDRKDLLPVDARTSQKFTLMNWLGEHSETINLIRDIRAATGVTIYNDTRGWNFSDFAPHHLSEKYLDSALRMQEGLLPAYAKRLDELISICRENNIQPVFITQPLVAGDGHAEIDFHEFGEENGQLFWLKLERYNAVTRKTTTEKRVPLIDLATLLPKDTTYYCDVMHYTNAGAQKVADIIYDRLVAQAIITGK